MTHETPGGERRSKGGDSHDSGDVQAAAQLKDNAQEAARAGLGTARDAAREGLDHMKAEARDAAQRTRERIVAGSGVFADAVRQAADTFDERGEVGMAGLTRAMATGIEQLNADLENRDMSELVEDFTAFARRNPAAAIGGAAVAGFLVSRFLRSSGRHRDHRATGAPGQPGLADVSGSLDSSDGGNARSDLP